MADTLEEKIQQLIALGGKDPLLIARTVMKDKDESWILGELGRMAEDVIAALARQRLSAMRRSSELALRPGDETASGELKLRSFWIPGTGWLAASKVTPTHLRERAAWEEKLAAAISRRVEWCRDVADLMEKQGAKTLGGFEGALPPLPESELELVA